MLKELDADYIVINGSDEGRRIDTLRTYIRDFASTVSFTGRRKYVILDEADYLTADSVQPALRNFIEEFSSNCGFILTCNYKNKLIEPLRSRCSTVEFKIQKKDKEQICIDFFKRILDVLNKEEIEYDKAAVAELVSLHFPDFRKIINELQKYSATGKIDTGILSNFNTESFKTIVSYLKEKDFNKMRRWVAQNSDLDFASLLRMLYDTCSDYLETDSVANFILVAADYQFKHAFVANPEINTVAFLTDVMLQCSFK